MPQTELLEKLLTPIFHLRQEDDEGDLGDEIEEAGEDAGEAIDEAVDAVGNALAPHTKPKNQNELD